MPQLLPTNGGGENGVSVGLIVSGVVPANQTEEIRTGPGKPKKGPKRKVHEFRPFL